MTKVLLNPTDFPGDAQVPPWLFLPSRVVAALSLGPVLPGMRMALPDGLEAVVEVAFRVSMLREERRTPRVALFLHPPYALFQSAAVFTSQPTLSIDWLRKVGAGFDPADTALSVEAGPQPRVRGIVSRLYADLFVDVGGVPTALIEVRGPADLLVDHFNGSVAFRRDRYVVPTRPSVISGLISAELVQDFLNRLPDWIHRHCPGAEMSSKLMEKGACETFIREQMAQCILDLAIAAVTAGVGLGIAVVPVQCIESLSGLVTTAEWLNEDTTRSGGERFTQSSERLWAIRASGPRLVRDEMGPWEDEAEWYAAQTEAHRGYRRQLRRTVQTGTADGAIILDATWRPAAMAAKFANDERNLAPPVKEWLAQRAKGTRHKSMAAVLGSLPGALGLVVSSDGEAVVFQGGPDAQAPFELDM